MHGPPELQSASQATPSLTHLTPWPMGESDGTAPDPLIFQPKGFLVAIRCDSPRAERARDALIRHGFSVDDLRVYSSEQILDDHAARRAHRGFIRRFVRAATTDPETPKLYLGYARDGRSALWLRIPERADANRAIAFLADHDVLHFRYYGMHGGQDDIHVH